MHVYVDEARRDGYLLVAAVVAPHQATDLRRDVRALVMPGQRRIHAFKESPARRRLILDRFTELGFTATLYEASGVYKTDWQRRAACLERLVTDVAEVRDARLCLETADGVDQRDRQQLIGLTRELGCRDTLTYEHQHAAQEPLLAVPDMIGWAWTRGGDWKRRADPMVTHLVIV
ncbi:MAG TPA: hypothetical protein VGK35_11970 [Actinotalea sp.]